MNQVREERPALRISAVRNRPLHRAFSILPNTMSARWTMSDEQTPTGAITAEHATLILVTLVSSSNSFTKNARAFKRMITCLCYYDAGDNLMQPIASAAMSSVRLSAMLTNLAYTRK